MSDHESKFQSCERDSLAGEEKYWVLPKQHRWLSLASWVPAILGVIMVTMLQAMPARAQASPTPTQTPLANPCPTNMIGQPLIPVPEIATKDGKLQGTVLLSDEKQWMAFRVPVSAPTSQSRSQCFPQLVRMFRRYPTTAPTTGTTAAGTFPLPMPGPTLRARVGDLVQLTFINQINPNHFIESIDRGEIGACDPTSLGKLSYPGDPANGGDQFPDCFHGSSTGNIHFHGTHTNPGATGDNVFIEVRPSLRVDDKPEGKPIVTPESVKTSFDEFFKQCEAKLSTNVLKQWPKVWGDLPSAWTAEQEKLIKEYDAQLEAKYPGAKVDKKYLWPTDKWQLEHRLWPQYYIGAVPYCFRLPAYTQTVWPPPPPPAMAGMSMGADAAENEEDSRVLMMGQAPGTHWYHAHKHGSTAIDVANGMTGAFIIEGQYDDDLNAFYGAEFTTRKASVLVINQLGVSPNLMRGSAGQQDKGPDFSVNGQLKPVISMQPNEVQMWRIVNTSGRAGALFVGPPKGFHWRQLAQDGVQFNDVNYQSHVDNSFLLAAGNRADLLVQAPALPCANTDDCNVIVKNEVDPSDLVGPKAAQPLTLMSVKVSGPAIDPKSNAAKFIPTAPTFPAFLTDIASTEVKGTKKILFSSTGPGGMPTPAMHTIDGKKFDGEVGEVVLLNTVEEWKVMNATTNGISHPFHIHINPFQVVEVFDPNATLSDPATGKQVNKYVFDKRALKVQGQCYLDPNGDPDNWKPCDPNPYLVQANRIWWDVFPIPSAAVATDANGNQFVNPATKQAVNVPGYFKMRSRFVDYTGYYVIHCHILAHEDRGMMTVVEVAPAKSPYSHH
jgi:FtsP/CotA-like multicopper oxidase with cupredoxin domain